MMDEMDIYYIWLNELRGLSLNEKKNLLTLFGDPKAIHDRPEKELLELLHTRFFTGRQSKKAVLTIEKDLDEAWRIYDGNERLGIKILTYGDSHYRERANLYASLPVVLYYRGILKKTDVKKIGIVGSRKASTQGHQLARLTCRQITGTDKMNGPWIIVSGLSEGVDAVVLDEALSQGRGPYAFTAQGLDTCQSQLNVKLMSRIADMGAVISPYPLGNHIKAYQFHKTNVVMAAFIDELIVIEAGANSGILSLAHAVIQNGLIVRVVPGSVFRPNCKGSNHLLLEGASPYIPDIVESAVMTHLKQSVITLLIDNALTTEELSNILGLGLSEVEAELVEMEMDDDVQYRADGRWHSHME